MARVTIEDCLKKIPNRFQLVLTATKRARQLSNGAEPQVDPENDKFTVIALREIAEGYIKLTTAEHPEEMAEMAFVETGAEAETEAGAEAETEAGAEAETEAGAEAETEAGAEAETEAGADKMAKTG